ncbi:MAG: lipoyl synthase [Bacteroidota bacterium]
MSSPENSSGLSGNSYVSKKPDWLRKKLPSVHEYAYLKKILIKNNLHTICESGKCPNIGECWEKRTATFMILGSICTRSCGFCAVQKGKPFPPDLQEPNKVAEAVQQMQLKHCVITSVNRDDLPDGGAEIWLRTVTAIRKLSPGITIETLIPDFKGNIENISKVISSAPGIISHNLETVERLTKKVRVHAKYTVSLDVLKRVSESGIVSKSGIMLGLGEKEEEIFQTMDDLLNNGCKIITLGQYLQPGKKNLAVEKYILPSEFEKYRLMAKAKGFLYAECGPLVRSSYHSEEQLNSTIN